MLFTFLAMKMEGIYRLNGQHSKVTSLLQEFKKSMYQTFTSFTIFLRNIYPCCCRKSLMRRIEIKKTRGFSVMYGKKKENLENYHKFTKFAKSYLIITSLSPRCQRHPFAAWRLPSSWCFYNTEKILQIAWWTSTHDISLC